MENYVLNLYYFRLSRYGVFVAARNWRTAKQYAVSEFRKTYPRIRISDVTGYRVKEKTDAREGIYTRSAVLLQNEPWWTCPSCGETSFSYINGGTGYRCLKCGKEGVIPDVVPECYNGKNEDDI